MARLARFGILLIAVLAVAWAAEDGDDVPPDTPEPESGEESEAASAPKCVLEWTPEEVSSWYIETAKHADAEKYGALLKEQAVTGKLLDDTVASDEALTDMGLEDAEARSELVKAWTDIKDTTCEAAEEELDPKYLLPPLTLGSTLACSACERVVDAVWEAVVLVKPSVEEKSLKERREAAHKVVDDVCAQISAAEISGERYEEKFTVHKPAKKKDKKKDDKKDSAGEEEEAEADAADAAEAADEEEEEEAADAADEEAELDELAELGNAEDTAKLQEACTLMVANHGLKLKSKLAGFYKETTKDGIRKKMCFQWQDLCYAPPKPKLKKREKCLMKAFKAIQNKEWEMAAKYTACAKKALKVKQKKSAKKDESQEEPTSGEPEIEVVEPEGDGGSPDADAPEDEDVM